MSTKHVNHPTRTAKVLLALKSARRGRLLINGETIKTTGGWVDGAVLTAEQIGGPHGLRRLRELRQRGIVNIEKRRTNGTYQYRIAR